MKKIKQFRLLLPVLALSIAICASAFSKVPNKFATITSYFANETHVTGGAPATIPASYTDITTTVNGLTPPPGETKLQDYGAAHCPSPMSLICAVQFQINTITHAQTLITFVTGTWQ